MNQSKPLAIAALIVIAAAGAGYWVGSGEARALNDQLTRQAEQMATVDAERLKLEKALAEAEANLGKQEDQTRFTPILEPWMLQEIQERGGTSPEALIQDLEEKPELIPTAAVLGGTMRFSSVRLLNERWALADFEDGHIAGRAIYSWWSEGGQLRWRLELLQEE